MKCSLCNSDNITMIEKLDAGKIISLYKRDLNCDVAHLIKEDIQFFLCNNCGLKFFYPLVIGDEKFYNSLQKFEWYYLDDKYEYQIAGSYILKKNKVLEVGCGKGAFAKQIETKDYLGLDLSKAAKDIAFKNGITIHNESIVEHSVKYPETYDVVVSFQVLEHVPDPYVFLSSCIKTLKKNGLMIVAVPNDNSFLKYAQNSLLNMPPHHLTRWTDKAINNIADIFNLQLMEIHHERVQEIHYNWYRNTLFSILLRNKLGIKHKLLANFRDRIVSKFSAVINRFVAGSMPEEFFGDGHTVVAIYKKKND